MVQLAASGLTSNDFVFSSYVLLLKDAYKGRVSNQDLITLLYGFISIPCKLMVSGSGDRYIDCGKKQASAIINRTSDVNGKIREHCMDNVVCDSIVAEFASTVLPKLHPSKIDNLVSQLLDIVESAGRVGSYKEDLRGYAESGLLADFLARAFQESLIDDNRLPDDPGDNALAETGAFPKHGGRINPDIPERIADVELPYVTALMKVYSEKEPDSSITPEDPGRHKPHFQRQRKDYYSAEFVRRCMRDTYKDAADDHFENLEDEIYDGVIETYEMDYDCGHSRLSKVLDRASLVPMDGVWVSRDTDWIKSGVKKGVCHILVNEDRIRGWLDDDREDI